MKISNQIILCGPDENIKPNNTVWLRWKHETQNWIKQLKLAKHTILEQSTYNYHTEVYFMNQSKLSEHVSENLLTLKPD
jgi:hypothetical protein